MARASPEIKAAALADLATGEQPAVVAERYQLNFNTVRSWKIRNATLIATENATPAAPFRRPRQEAQQDAIGELVIDLLRAKLEASRAIAKTACDSAWLVRQSAADLAALGDYFDATALAFGDRLAGGVPSDLDRADG